MYNINLQATHTTILCTRGVQIPIYLVSSASDSIRQRIVLFKTVTIPTSDLKSEFLCYVTVGTFARRGLSSTVKTLRSLSGVSRF